MGTPIAIDADNKAVSTASPASLENFCRLAWDGKAALGGVGERAAEIGADLDVARGLSARSIPEGSGLREYDPSASIVFDDFWLDSFTRPKEGCIRRPRPAGTMHENTTMIFHTEGMVINM